MFNRAGYQRIFIEAVRRRGEAIHIREIRGGGVSRDELSFADLWGVDYNPGELVFPDQRVRMTWIPSPLVCGGRLLFICPDKAGGVHCMNALLAKLQSLSRDELVICIRELENELGEPKAVIDEYWGMIDLQVWLKKLEARFD